MDRQYGAIGGDPINVGNNTDTNATDVGNNADTNVVGNPNSVCAADKLTNVQKSLQTHMKGCENSSECPSHKCCYASYCVCWPIEKLALGLGSGACI